MCTTRKAAGLLFLFVIAPGTAWAMVQHQATGDESLPGQIYVQFTGDNQRFSAGRTGAEAFDVTANRYSVTHIEKAFPSLDVIAGHRPLTPSMEALRRIYIVHYAVPDPPRHVAAEFARVPAVRYAEPIYAEKLLSGMQRPSPNIPLKKQGSDGQAIPNDFDYKNQIELPYMELESAWDVVKGQDNTALIAFVNGGVYWKHEDLAANVWTNPNEVDGDGLDNDNNGYVDDIHGWNFTHGTPDPDGPADSTGTWYSTNVAGASSAVTDNEIGIAGASWNAAFMGLNTSCNDSIPLCHTLKGIVYAAMNGADVIAAQYGNDDYSVTGELTYQAATDEGALIVATAGHDGTDNDITPFYPASYPVVLSVGATEKTAWVQGAVTDRSMYNYGKTVNVFAPGEWIFVLGTHEDGEDTYGVTHAVSFGAPLVAGAAALVKTAFPHFDAHQVREQIRLTAVSIDHANAPPGKFGRGKVDAYAAVTAAQLPAIRVVDWSYQSQEGYPEVVTLDTVEVTVTFTNYHGTGSGLSAELTSNASFLEWHTPTVSLGSMNKGDSLDATYRFTFTGFAPEEGTVSLSPRITAPGFEDSPDLFSLPFKNVFVLLAASLVSLSEGDGDTTVTVTANSTSTFTTTRVFPISVTGSGTANAVNFVPVADFDLTLPAHATTATATFTLTPIDNTAYNTDEAIIISSSSPVVLNPLIITLHDDESAPDGIRLSVSPDDIREDDGATTITVSATVDGTTLYGSEKVLNVLLAGSGVAGAVDFTPIPEFSLTVPAEAASATANFVLTPENDEEGEADETITIRSDSTFVLSGATLVIRDDDGGRTSHDSETEVLEFGVAPPYPNPASGPVTFVLSSPESTDWARLRLYNILGQAVAAPYEGTLRAGQHTVRYDGRHLPAGVYLYIFESRDTRVSGQLIMAQ